MGRKRTQKRHHLFLYIACFMIVLSGIFGCLSSPKKNIYFPEKLQAEQQLMRSKVLMEKGDFPGALKKAEDVYKEFPKTYGSQALFQIGLIYAHPENPGLDYKKSSEYLDELSKRSDFDKSSIKDETLILSHFLEKSIKKETNGKEEKIKILNGKVAKLKREVSNLESQIVDLKNQIKQLKEIDLKIEEKKREVMP